MNRRRRRKLRQTIEWKPHIITKTMQVHFNSGGHTPLKLKRLQTLALSNPLKRTKVRVSLFGNQTDSFTEVFIPMPLNIGHHLISAIL